MWVATCAGSQSRPRNYVTFSWLRYLMYMTFSWLRYLMYVLRISHVRFHVRDDCVSRHFHVRDDCVSRRLKGI